LIGADHATQLALFIGSAGARGLTHADLRARTGWRDEVLAQGLQAATTSGAIVAADGVFISHEAFARLVQAAVEAVAAHHQREPLQKGLARETLRERAFAHAPQEIFRAVLTAAETSGALVSERDTVRAAAHSLALSPTDAALQTRLEAIYAQARLAAPTFDEALAQAGAKTAREHGRRLLQLLLDAGTLVRVTNELLFHRAALDQLVADLRRYAAQHEPERLIDVAAFKDLAGVSRKYAIPLLEYLDRERITRRAGDRRMIL
jgi:selenocysteine-specific elongation factor